MTVRLPTTDLDVVGYVGRAGVEDAPRRLLPIFRTREGGRVVMPPVRDDGDVVEGQEASERYLAVLVDDEEVTLLRPPLAARRAHTLWMSSTGPRYQASRDVDAELDAWVVAAVRDACASGLIGDDVRDTLFGALRVRPTVMANALLAVHFQLTGDTRLARPIREDLATLTDRDTGPLERRILNAAEPLLSSSADIATAVAMEARRARRADLAEEVLVTVPTAARSASESAPPFSWAALRAWGRT